MELKRQIADLLNLDIEKIEPIFASKFIPVNVIQHYLHPRKKNLDGTPQERHLSRPTILYRERPKRSKYTIEMLKEFRKPDSGKR